tara:strand:+ start:853 stop:1041 length:189 start_codon:yes stop_codon:yes gene_type:complete
MEGIKAVSMMLISLFKILVEFIVVVGTILIGIVCFLTICLIVVGMELMDIFGRYKRKPIVYK